MNTRIDRPHGLAKVTSLSFRPGVEDVQVVTTGEDGNVKAWRIRRTRNKKGSEEGELSLWATKTTESTLIYNLQFRGHQDRVLVSGQISLDTRRGPPMDLSWLFPLAAPSYSTIPIPMLPSNRSLSKSAVNLLKFTLSVGVGDTWLSWEE